MILWSNSHPHPPEAGLGLGRTKLSFIKLKQTALATSMPSQFQHIKCWQCSQPSRPHASATSPLSPTLTLLSNYLRAGPVFSVKGTFNVSLSPHLWAVLCYFTSYRYVLLQCQHWKCHSLPPHLPDWWFFFAVETPGFYHLTKEACAVYLCLAHILCNTAF